MKKVSAIMKNYFSSDSTSGFGLIKESMPICPVRDTWHIVDSPERLSKRFEFKDRPRLSDFVMEIMKYEDEVNHHAMIRFNHLSVDIEVYTVDLDRVTNLDREYAIAADLIFQDVKNYAYEDKREETITNFF